MKILFIHFGNFLKVQGATEPYYVYRFLKRNHQVTAVGIGEVLEYVDGEEEEFHTLSGSGAFWSKVLPGWLFLDLKALKVVKDLKLDSFDLVWTYRGTLLTPFWLTRAHQVSWIMDLRVPPVEQNEEFLEYRGELSVRRSIYNQLMKNVYRKALERTDKVLSVSSPLKDFLVSDYEVDPEKTYVQPLGVDLSTFMPRNERIFGKKSIKIVCVSSIAPHRKLELLIEIMSDLEERGIEADMTVIGDGFPKYLESLKEFASREGVSEQIHWEGFLDHDDIPALLDGCDIGLSPLPDLFSYRVSSPAKVYEYLAMELVVIASDIKAHREILTEGETGLLVSPEDASSWVGAIARVAEDTVLRRKLQSNARESVKRYDWDRMMEGLEKSLLGSLR